MSAATDAWAILLPPGWVRFPTGPGQERELGEAIEAVVARALPDDLPRDSAEPYRRMLRDELHKNLAAARDEADAGAVYLPTEPVNGVMVPASITEVELVTDAGADPLDVILTVLSDADGRGGGYDESEAVELDGRPGVRVQLTSRDIAEPGLPVVSTRQVVYCVSRDDAAGVWLVLSFSTVWDRPGSELLAETLALFFDAVLSTFRWVGGDVGSSPDR